METKTQLAILGQLLKEKKPQSIRGIARSLKKSYPLIYNSIEELRKKELIIKEKLPPAQMIRLSESISVEVLARAEEWRREAILSKYKWMKVYLRDVMSSAKTSLFILAIFGSYAQETQTVKSDVDILAIFPKKEDIKGMESVLAHPYTEVKKHIIVVSEADYLEMISKPFQLNVGNESLKSHIILYGGEQYYNLVQRIKMRR